METLTLEGLSGQSPTTGCCWRCGWRWEACCHCCCCCAHVSRRRGNPTKGELGLDCCCGALLRCRRGAAACWSGQCAGAGDAAGLLLVLLDLGAGIAGSEVGLALDIPAADVAARAGGCCGVCVGCYRRWISLERRRHNLAELGQRECGDDGWQGSVMMLGQSLLGGRTDAWAATGH